MALFLHVLYYANEGFFKLKLSMITLALRGAGAGKILFDVGKGGDGKGVAKLLGDGLFGAGNSSTLGCACF